jgi:hypothetical protein
MSCSTRLVLAFVALVALPAAAADFTGQWTATFGAAGGQRTYTYVFRQNGAELIGTARSQDGLFVLENGSVNNKTVWFSENFTFEGQRVVFEYTGELVSDTEIRFKRQAAGAPSSAVQFVATRIGTR